MKKLIVILLICLATQFVFVSKGVVYGNSIASLEGKINRLEDENDKLEIEIASLSSCAKISEKNPEAILSLSGVSGSAIALKK